MAKITKKGSLHPRNAHKERYDFKKLVKVCPELNACVTKNPNGQSTINFSDAHSVLLLNKALLAYFYQIHFWQVPKGYLCPPIPGRVDYIHYIADLLAESYSGSVPQGQQIKGLDIGCGANCIYPLLGARSYDWSFVGVDINAVAVKSAKALVQANSNIKHHIEIKQQPNLKHIFKGVIHPAQRFAFTLCNPPFHSSMKKAQEGSLLKQANLRKNTSSIQSPSTKNTSVNLNFAGQTHELSCAGGEIAFVKKMVKESLLVKEQVCWFTCLLSKKENINPIKRLLSSQKAIDVRVVNMSQGQKISRFIAWTYLDVPQQQAFFDALD